MMRRVEMTYGGCSGLNGSSRRTRGIERRCECFSLFLENGDSD